MKLVELIRALSPDDVHTGINVDGNIDDGIDNPDLKIRLAFSDGNHPELNLVVPAGHPVLIAWYNEEVEFIKVPAKNVLEVSFEKYFCE